MDALSGAAGRGAESHRGAATAASEHAQAARSVAVEATNLTGIVAGLDFATGHLAGGFSQARAELLDFARGAETAEAGAALLGVALVALAAGAANALIGLADRVRETAEQTGLSIPTVQALGYQFETIGQSADASGRALQIFERNVGTLADQIDRGSAPTGKMALDLEKLGIDLGTFLKLNPDQQLAAVADAFRNASDSLNKTQIAMDLFGRSGANLIPILNQGSAATNEAKAAIDASGASIGVTEKSVLAYHKSMADLTLAMQGFEVVVGGPVINAITGLSREVLSAEQHVRDLLGIFHLLPAPIQETITKAQDANDKFHLLTDALHLSAGAWDAAKLDWSGAADQLGKVKDNTDGAASAVTNATGPLAFAATNIDTVGKTAAVAGPLVDQLGATFGLMGNQAKASAVEVEGFDTKVQSLLDVFPQFDYSLKHAKETTTENSEAYRVAADNVKKLDDAWNTASSSGNVQSMIDTITQELDSGLLPEIAKAHEQIVGMLKIPSPEENELTRQLHATELQIDTFNAKLSNGNASQQHIAHLQNIVDQDKLSGAAASKTAADQAELDRQIEYDPSGAAFANAQKTIDFALKPHQQALKDNIKVEQDKTQASADTATQEGKTGLTETERARLLGLSSGKVEGSYKDQTTATGTAGKSVGTLATDTEASAVRQKLVIDPIARAWDLVTAAIGGAIAKVGSIPNILGSGSGSGGMSFPGVGPGGLMRPTTSGSISQPYGPTDEALEPMINGQHFHQGEDFAIPVGTTLGAAGAGVVKAIGRQGQTGLGLSITIDLGNGLEETFGHLSSTLLTVGDRVAAGATVGLSGGAVGDPNSGLSEGPHTHIVTTRNGVIVDPETVWGTGSSSAGSGSMPAGLSGNAGDIAGWAAANAARFGVDPGTLARALLTVSNYEDPGGTSGNPFQFSGGTRATAEAAGFNVTTASGSLDAFAASGDLQAGIRAYQAAGGGEAGAHAMEIAMERPNGSVDDTRVRRGDFSAAWRAAGTTLSGNAGPGVGTAPGRGATEGGAADASGGDAAAGGSGGGPPVLPAQEKPVAGDKPLTPDQIAALSESATTALNTIQGQITTLTGAYTAADSETVKSAFDTAQARLGDASGAEAKLLADLNDPNGVSAETIRQDQLVVNSTTHAANAAVAAWHDATTSFTGDSALRTTQAEHEASGQQALVREGADTARIAGIGVVAAHREVNTQTLASDVSTANLSKQAALNANHDVLEAQRDLNTAQGALDDANLAHASAIDIADAASGVAAAQARLTAAQNRSTGLTALAVTDAATTQTDITAYNAGWDATEHLRISSANRIADFQIQANNMSLTQQQRDNYAAAAAQLPAYIAADSQLSAAIAAVHRQLADPTLSGINRSILEDYLRTLDDMLNANQRAEAQMGQNAQASATTQIAAHESVAAAAGGAGGGGAAAPSGLKYVGGSGRHTAVEDSSGKLWYINTPLEERMGADTGGGPESYGFSDEAARQRFWAQQTEQQTKVAAAAAQWTDPTTGQYVGDTEKSRMQSAEIARSQAQAADAQRAADGVKAQLDAYKKIIDAIIALQNRPLTTDEALARAAVRGLTQELRLQVGLI